MTRPGYLRKNKESNLAGAYSTCRRGTEIGTRVGGLQCQAMTLKLVNDGWSWLGGTFEQEM